MATLEDILNASDSDDSEIGLSTEYDLEKILQLDDDDLTDGIDNYEAIVNPQPSSVVLNTFPRDEGAVGDERNVETFSSFTQHLVSSEDLELLALDEPVVFEDFIHENTNSAKNTATELIFADSVSLLNAARREKRFFRFESAPIVSALRAKRNATVMDIQPHVKFTTMERINAHLRRNSSYKAYGPGTVTSMAASSKLIAIGTSKGLIVIFDQHQDMRQIFGAGTTSKSLSTAITALVFTMSDHLIISGHSTGELCVWDVEKGSTIKIITDLHTSSISELLVAKLVDESLYATDAPSIFTTKTSAKRDAKTTFSSDLSFGGFNAGRTHSNSPLVLVSIDASGILHKLSISRSLWSYCNVESDCLLDGSSGKVFGAAVLPALIHCISRTRKDVTDYVDTEKDDDNNINFRSEFLSLIGSASFFAMNVGSHTWIIQLSPHISVLHKWKLQSEADPIVSLDWSWVNISDVEGLNDWKPILARSCGSKIDSLIMEKLNENALHHVPSATSNPVHPHQQSHTKTSSSRISFHVSRSVSLSDPLISVKWLNQEQLVCFTKAGGIVTVNQHMEQLTQHTAQLPLQQSVFGVYEVEHAGNADSIILIEETRICCYDDRIIFNHADVVYTVQVQSYVEMAQEMIDNGQWLDALALVLENMGPTNESIMDDKKINQMILKYVQLAVKQPVIMSVSCTKKQRNHFHLVAGVCIEFCIGTNSMDVLYGPLFDIFTTVQQQNIFLESLEQYILHGEIQYLPDRILVQFCECLKKGNRLNALERCIVRFNLQDMDVEFLTRFLFDNQMFSAFLYAYSNGAGDYAAAFNIVFHWMLGNRAQPGNDTQGEATELSAAASDDEMYLVYKLLVFLHCTFQRKDFPSQNDANNNLTSSQHWQLLQILCCEVLVSPPNNFPCTSVHGSLERFPYLQIFSRLDPTALMDCVYKGIRPMQQLSDQSKLLTTEPTEDLLYSALPSSGGSDVDIKSEIGKLYDAVMKFCEIFDKRNAGRVKRSNSHKTLNSAAESTNQGVTIFLISIFLEAFMPSIAACSSRLSTYFLSQLIDYCATCSGEQRRLYEQQLKLVAQHQSHFMLESMKLKEYLCLHNFWIASLQLKRVYSEISEEYSAPRRYHVGLRYYLALSMEEGNAAACREYSFSVFEYIVEEYEQLHTLIDEHTVENNSEALNKEVLSCLSRLYGIDPDYCKEIVHRYLLRNVPSIIECTRNDIRMQFELLDCIVQNLRYSSNESLLDAMHFTDVFDRNSTLVYFNLLCKFEANSTLHFLKNHESAYPIDECLQICKEYGISEATAYLMEKTGDSREALRMLMIDFSLRLKAARKEIDSQLRHDLQTRQLLTERKKFTASHAAIEEHSLVSQILAYQGNERSELIATLPVYKGLSNIVNCAADLCDRHSDDGSSEMWFQIFDHLLLERHAVRSGTLSSSGELVIAIVGQMLQLLMIRMKGSIDPQNIIMRVTSEGNSAGMRLGEFKDVVLNMIISNEQELLLYEAINRTFIDDLVSLHARKIRLLRKYYNKGDKDEDSPDTHQANLLFSPSVEERKPEYGSDDGSDALFDELNHINTNIDLTQFKVTPVPWSKPDIKENYRKWKLAIGRNNEVAIRTTLPADTSDILFQPDDMLEERHPGALNEDAVYHASLSFVINE